MFDERIDFGPQTTGIVIRKGLLTQAAPVILHALDGARVQVVLVTDRTVGPLYADLINESLARSGFDASEFRMEPGEPSKSLAVTSELYDHLADRRISRDALLIALGGGVVSDLTGFVAATWMRGIRFAIFPTTLEAAIDAAIGGKTGVNLPCGKNLVGAFHQPLFVGIDPNCLRSLDSRDIRAGLAESVKHAAIRSADFFAWQEEHAEAVLALDENTLSQLILSNVRIKGEIVARDTREQGDLRILLNLGHTIGHAIETNCAYTLRHGECVSLGMVAACRLSERLGLLLTAEVDRVVTLLSRIGLPVRLSEAIDADRILNTMRHDKKIKGGLSRLILLEGIGRAAIHHDVPESVIREVYESLQS